MFDARNPRYLSRHPFLQYRTRNLQNFPRLRALLSWGDLNLAAPFGPGENAWFFVDKEEGTGMLTRSVRKERVQQPMILIPGVLP
jgi:hypothetical protein